MDRAYNPTVLPHHRGVSFWPALFFLVFFALLIAFVSHYYLLPALEASQAATQPALARLRAEAALLLTILLVMLFCGLVLMFKIHRFFLPRPKTTRTQTKYVDVWAEAGRRAKDEP